MADLYSPDSSHPDYTTPYGNLPGYKDSFAKLVSFLRSGHADDAGPRKEIISKLDTLVNTVKSKAKDKLGRDLTDDEISTYLKDKGQGLLQGLNQFAPNSGFDAKTKSFVDSSADNYIKGTFQNTKDAQNTPGAFAREGVTYESPYANIPGYEQAFNRKIAIAALSHSDSPEARQRIIKDLDNGVDQFKNIFSNSVGRDPTAEEFKKAFTENISPAMVEQGMSGQTLRDSITQYIGDTFKRAAEQTAQDKTTALSSQYGSLADTFLEQGKKSLGGLSDSLKQFSTSLFEKLRPQLSLAAQAGGYADSGGQTLQEQGALKDLAANSESVLGQANYDLNNRSDAIRFAGESGPLSLASSYASNAPTYLASVADKAGTNLTGYYNNSLAAQNRLSELGYADQLSRQTSPNFFDSLWKDLALGAAKGFSSGAGNRLNNAKWLN